MTAPMKVACRLLLIAGLMGLSSCGLVRSATQLPIRTLQSVGRAVGLGLEHSEVIEDGEEE